jgi:hypothetical protein
MNELRRVEIIFFSRNPLFLESVIVLLNDNGLVTDSLNPNLMVLHSAHNFALTEFKT